MQSLKIRCIKLNYRYSNNFSQNQKKILTEVQHSTTEQEVRAINDHYLKLLLLLYSADQVWI